MPDFGIYAGDTDKTIYLRLRDSTTGLAKTGLAYNSTGAVCSYTLPLAARAAISLATQTVTGAHSDGGFVEIDATNCKGLYRLDLPDAAIASGAFTIVSIEFDGIIEESVEIPLHTRKVNATQIGSQNVGLSSDNRLRVDVAEWNDIPLATTNPLPNAAADAAGGLVISDAGGLDIDAKLANTNEVTTARMGALTDWIDGGRLDLLIDAMKAKTDSLTFTVAGDVDCNVQTWGGTEISTAPSVKLADGVTHGGTTALLRLGSSTSTPAFYVTNSGGSAMRLQVTGGNGTGLQISGEGSGHGISALGGSTNGDGFNLGGNGSAPSGGGLAFSYKVFIADGALTDATLAGAMETVFETDFAANYDTTNDRWIVGSRQYYDRGLSQWKDWPVNLYLFAIDASGFVDLVDAPNATAVAAIQSGLATSSALASLVTTVGVAGDGLTAADDAVIAAIAALTIPTAAQNATAVLTTQMTEAYASDGTAPTAAEALFLLISACTEFSISGTTITCKKLDGSTTAATYTLDDATTPTSRTRAT